MINTTIQNKNLQKIQQEFLVINKLKQLSNLYSENIINTNKYSLDKMRNSKNLEIQNTQSLQSSLYNINREKFSKLLLKKSTNSRLINYFFSSYPINLLFSIDQFLFEFAKKQSGNFFRNKKSVRRKSGEFQQQLKERKKLAIFYGYLSKKQIKNIISQSKSYQGYFSKNFFSILERRLDVILYRSGLVKNIITARQLISHKKIKVNNNIINIASYQVNPGDIISITNKNQIISALSKTITAKIKKYRSRFTNSLNYVNKLKNRRNLKNYKQKKTLKNHIRLLLTKIENRAHLKLKKSYNFDNLLQNNKLTTISSSNFLTNNLAELSSSSHFDTNGGSKFGTNGSNFVYKIESELNIQSIFNSKFGTNLEPNKFVNNFGSESNNNVIIKTNDSNLIELNWNQQMESIYFNRLYKSKNRTIFNRNTNLILLKLKPVLSKEAKSFLLMCLQKNYLSLDKKPIFQNKWTRFLNILERNIFYRSFYNIKKQKKQENVLFIEKKKNLDSFGNFSRNKYNFSAKMESNQIKALKNFSRKLTNSATVQKNSFFKNYSIFIKKRTIGIYRNVVYKTLLQMYSYSFYSGIYSIINREKKIKTANNFFTLKLKKHLIHKRSRKHILRALRISLVKPMHIEVSYNTSTAILLYSPQRLSFPFYIDVDLILRSFR